MPDEQDKSKRDFFADELRKTALRHQHLVRQLSILREIDRFDDFSIESEEVFRRLLETLAFGLATENCSLFLLDDTGQYLELRAACGAVEEHGKSFAPGDWGGRRFAMGEGVIGRVAQTGQPILIDDVTKDPSFVARADSRIRVRSLLCFPLRIEDKTIGVLNLSHASAGAFSLEEQRALEMMAERIAHLIKSHLLHRRLREELAERIHTLEALQESLETMAGIENAIPAGLIVYRFVEPDKLLVSSVNPEAERLLGVRGTDSWGKEMSEVFPGVEKAGLRAAVMDVLKTGRSYDNDNLEYEDHRVKGSFRVRAFRMSGGRAGVAFEDITQRKRSEEARAELQAQLEQGHRMQALGTLAGGIAHDFNNILAGILGYAEFALQDAAEPEKVCDSLEQVLAAGARAKELVRQILTFSRQTKGDRKPSQLAPIVKETVSLLRASIPTTIDIRTDIAADCGMALADPTQIHQLLTNLCINASHAMRRKGGLLTVALKTCEADARLRAKFPEVHEGRYLKLSVADTGHGMDRGTMARIFDPFFTTKPGGEGSGLGLSVVQGIVKSHDGIIEVESEPDRGTRFDVYLPECAGPSIEADAVPAATPAPAPRGNESILFVDDEVSIVRLASEMLRALGYLVTARTSSVAALEEFRARPDEFDLVITDLTMPNLTGVDLARELAKVRPGIPVILISGYNDLLKPLEKSEAGIREALTKPFTTAELGHAIRRVLAKPA